MQFTRRRFLQFCSANVVLPWMSSLFATEARSSWAFGIIPDTQWWFNAPFHGTAIHVIDAINVEFIRQQVDFVIQIGDLAEMPSALAFQTRAAHNQSLTEAGIKFYPIRGNHDVPNNNPKNLDDQAMKQAAAAAQFTAAFPDLPGTSSVGSSPDLPGAAGMTYSFTHNDGKFILLDTFPMVDDNTKRSKTYTISDYLPWIEAELKRDDHRFALVFAHKPLQGQNHKDILFGENLDSNPEMQNAFMECLQRNGVRCFLCGHDHLYHHSRVKSPDGRSEVDQVICGSASHKFYLPALPLPERERPIAQELMRIGFVIVRINDDRISFEYYSARPFGAKPQTPQWELQDAFGHTQDGQSFGEPAETMKQFFRPER